MITKEQVLLIDKQSLPEASKAIDTHDLGQMVEWLSEQDDKIRYQVLLLLQNRSLHSADVYPFWDIFRDKLKSKNSYQRSIGLMMIACNAKWDAENRLEDTIDEYFALLDDEKPITVRQCIQSFRTIVPYKPHLNQKIANRLMSIDVSSVKATMRKLILVDIIEILVLIKKVQTIDGETINKIEDYINTALLGEILDKNSRKFIESVL